MRRWIGAMCLVAVGCGDDSRPLTAPDADPVDIDSVPTFEERRQEEVDAQISLLGYTTPKPQTDIPATLTLAGATELQVEYGDSVFYLLEGVSSFMARDYMVRPLLNGQFLTENRFLKQDGATVGLVFLSRKPSVVEATSSGGLRFQSAGKTSVIVGAGSDYIDLPIEVIELPTVSRYMTKTQVIESWGLADGAASAILDWLDSAVLSLKDYYNDEAGEDLYVEQWFYAGRIPKGYLEFRGSRSNSLSLYQARTTRWEHLLYSPVYPQFYTKK